MDFKKLFGNELQSKDGKVSVDVLSGKTVGLYFS